MKCKLCKSETKKLARSHIYPIGFFSTIETKGRVDTYKINGQKGRKLQKAIYDPEILCPDCEKRIVSYDDYAIKIFRDKHFSFETSSPKLPKTKLLIFEEIDKRKLRGFIGSLLWRISVSKQMEVANLSIGSVYEERIATDVLKGGDFSYVDVFSTYLEAPHHSVFFSPYKIKIDPINKQRDRQPINGWEITLPYLILRVSLDKRSNPLNHYVSLLPEITGKSEKIKASTSLNTDESYYFMFLTTDTHEKYTEEIHKVISNINLTV